MSAAEAREPQSEVVPDTKGLDASEPPATPNDVSTPRADAEDSAPNDAAATDAGTKDADATNADDAKDADATNADDAKDANDADATNADDAKDAPTDRVIQLLGDGGEASFVRRKIVVFRRLEPGDVRSAGSFVVEESPYLEARLVELRLPRATHREMIALAKKRRDTLAIASGLMRSYEPAGWILSIGGGGLVGVWLDYLPSAFLWPLVVSVFVGVLVGFATKLARTRAEAEADVRWRASADKKDHDALAKELAEAWARAQASLKRESGFHTVIRVAEGSVDPMRLASIDPRPYAADPPLFDPDDFLPSEEAGAVRYELVHATGEVVTRALDGTNDFAET